MSEGIGKVFQSNGNRQKSGVAIVISHKIDYKLKNPQKRQRYDMIIYDHMMI